MFALFPLLAFAPTAHAVELSQTIKDGLCAGANLDLTTDCSSGGVNNGEAAIKMTKFIKAIINILSIVIGAVAVIMIIIGGFKYITSGGSTDSVTGAKNTILYAVIGLIIVSLSQILVRFIIGKTIVLGN